VDATKTKKEVLRMFELKSKIQNYPVKVAFSLRDAAIVLPCKCEIVFDPCRDPENPWAIYYAHTCPHYSAAEGRWRAVRDPEEALQLLLPLLPAILEPAKRRR
jgi:hypothetical protein